MITAVFDDFLMSDDFVQTIFDAGCSSMNEYHHALLVNRRLVVKGESIRVVSYNFDVKYALSVIFFNLGERGTMRALFDNFKLKLNPIAEKEFTQSEKLAEIRRERNMAQKPVILAKRVKNQAQNQTSTKSRQEYVYRSVKEQIEFEQATKNVTVRKKRQKTD